MYLIKAVLVLNSSDLRTRNRPYNESESPTQREQYTCCAVMILPANGLTILVWYIVFETRFYQKILIDAFQWSRMSFTQNLNQLLMSMG